ncbi:MAG: N-acetyl-gamma-glutamyl-phosphate reductase, partial [Actinobacteria bacterium]|nr:N-acetyl-gamma-glutamyl-phosphate reductase [Actinomycetota bacterium]
MKIGVLGASGYAGGELLRLLSGHPDFEVRYIAAGSNAGEKITDLHSHLITYGDQRFAGTDIGAINNCDLIFLALPHGQSAEIVKQIDEKVKIVDLGADFRLKSEQAWKQYYNDSYAGAWAYGLPELPGKRDLIKKSSRVANPGCYATAIALAAAPAVLAGGVDA